MVLMMVGLILGVCDAGDPAVAQRDAAVDSHRPCFVKHYEKSLVLLVYELTKQRSQSFLGVQIHPSHRLVHHEKVRLRAQRSCDERALLLASRQ